MRFASSLPLAGSLTLGPSPTLPGPQGRPRPRLQRPPSGEEPRALPSPSGAPPRPRGGVPLHPTPRGNSELFPVEGGALRHPASSFPGSLLPGPFRIHLRAGGARTRAGRVLYALRRRRRAGLAAVLRRAEGRGPGAGECSRPPLAAAGAGRERGAGRGRRRRQPAQRCAEPLRSGVPASPAACAQSSPATGETSQ